MLKPSVFRSIAPALYLRAFCTSPPTVNEPKYLKKGDTDVLLEENKALLDKMQKQLEDMKSYAIQNFCKDLLEISDNLDLALESAKKKSEENVEIESTSLYKGLQITRIHCRRRLPSMSSSNSSKG
uniref:Uncharacterized protein n=1 Tax=Ditylenchus dipsaci TaxID=166011 RepID=A0A915CUT8_9BILA